MKNAEEIRFLRPEARCDMQPTSTQARQPFEAWSNESQVIFLRGHLDGSKEVSKRLGGVLSKVSGQPTVLIDADELYVFPEGAEAWIQATKQYLQRSRLVYRPSQLALLMQCDEEYLHLHPDSDFEEGP